MNREAVSQLFFDEGYVVPAGLCAQRLFREMPQGAALAHRLIDVMATSWLIATLESACVRELQPYVDPVTQAVVLAEVTCRHRGPAPAGLRLRLVGWVERMGESDVSFFVHAQDETETVCDGSIRLAIVRRVEIERVLERKRVAVARAALFAAA